LVEYGGKVWLDDVKTEAARRTITLSEQIMAVLKHRRKKQLQERLIYPGWENKHNLVFTNYKGGPLRRSDVGKGPLQRITKKAELEGVTLHTFRHTHTSILIYQKVDLKTISRRLGHQDVAFTLQVYTHLLPGQDEAAAKEMDAFIKTL